MKYPTRRIILETEHQRRLAMTAIQNAPLGLEVIVREPVKVRKSEQNSMQWAGVLRDFSEQGWVRGVQYSAVVWHFFLKQEHLPDGFVEGITMAGYTKWVELPNGQRSMIGSTTKLTVKGFAQYMTEVMAYGSSELGIHFTTIRDE